MMEEKKKVDLRTSQVLDQTEVVKLPPSVDTCGDKNKDVAHCLGPCCHIHGCINVASHEGSGR